MPTLSISTLVEQPAPSNRRQPIRRTRTNPARTASNLAQSQGGSLAQAPEGERIASPGFFPALTHFTDAITALPKEMTRNFTMLKEVDAKIWSPEIQIEELVKVALRAPVPAQKVNLCDQGSQSFTLNSSASIEASHSANITEDGSHTEIPSIPTSEIHDDPDLERRNIFHRMRHIMAETLNTLEEKNLVMNTAIACLETQMKRCNSSYPHIEDEISEEARYGSLNHWAYADKTAEKKSMMAGERTRRAANNAAAAAAIHETDGTSARGETRREATGTRKQRIQQPDSDFDDGRILNKKAPAGAKGRKVADANLSNGIGLGILNSTMPPSKRRKVDKPPMGNFPVEKAMTSVFGSNAGPSKGAVPSPRDHVSNDLAAKKKGRGGAAVSSTGRRRTNTVTSAANSPSLASSPVVGTFTVTKDRRARSPAPAILQRNPSSRARQNSTQSVLQGARNRSSSTNHKAINGNGLYGTTADVDKVSSLTGKSTGDVKSNMKEVVNANGEHLIEDINNGDGAGDLRGGLVVGSKNTDRALKREESVNENGRARPPSISVSTRGVNSKGPSKTATPINTSFSEPQKPRPPREVPVKRSHKKGAGIAAQIAAAAAAQTEDGSSLQGDEDDEDGDEPRYCYCNGVSYGEMVGCDGKECQREWFHLNCVGLARAPARNAKWYCDECKENLKDTKFNGSNGR